MKSLVEHQQALEQAVDLASAEKREFVANNPKMLNEPTSITKNRYKFYNQVESARAKLRLFKKGIAKNGRI